MVSNFEYAQAMEMYKELAKRDKCEIHNVVMDVEGDSDENGKVQYSSYCFICYCIETLKVNLNELKHKIKFIDDDDDDETMRNIRVLEMVTVDWLEKWKQMEEVI